MTIVLTIYLVMNENGMICYALMSESKAEEKAIELNKHSRLAHFVKPLSVCE